MGNANICPKCKRYILGEYCFDCQIDITSYSDISNMFDGKDIADIFDFFKKGDKNDKS